MIFNNAIHFSELPDSDSELKSLLNYNPLQLRSQKRQTLSGVPGRDPSFTDRAGWRGYDRVYSHYLSSFRYKKNKILEIGTWTGYGLLFFRRYFKNSDVFGIDINTNRYYVLQKQISSEFPCYKDVKIFPVDSTKPNHWKIFQGLKFDFIIEDGGHHPTTQLHTIKNGLNYLAPGGIYFIEDIDHRYGDDVLNDLSNFLLECSKNYEVTIYSHINEGLAHLVKNDQINNLNVPKENFNPTAYIAVIQDTKNGSK